MKVGYIMTEEEYERKLQWYRDRITYLETNSVCRRDREYCDYLKRWFGDGRCDGAPDYETRYQRRTLPMPYLIYFG